MPKIIAIAIGGAVGAVCRHGVNQACSQWLAVHPAWGTLAVNIMGCLLIGILVSLGTGVDARWSGVTHSALTIGFLGALTTFSAFGLETHRMIQQPQLAVAASNVVANMVAGLGAVKVGFVIGNRLAGA